MEADRRFIKQIFDFKKREDEIGESAGFKTHSIEILFVLNKISEIRNESTPAFEEDRLRTRLPTW